MVNFTKRFFNRKIVKSKLFSAFTIAEVLIVLGIIGIVAELTIPDLYANFQQQVYTTSLKKFYTEANQALILMANDYGCTGDLVCTGIFNLSNDDAGAVMLKYFKTLKHYNTSTVGDCWSNSTNTNYDGTGGTVNYNADNDYSFTTPDGMSVLLWSYQNNCGYAWSNSGSGPMSQTCGWLRVDVNGISPPNRFGRDVFTFFITNAKGAGLYPQGGIDDKYSGSNYYWDGPNKSCQTNYTNGIYCTGRIMEDNWQMKY